MAIDRGTALALLVIGGLTLVVALWFLGAGITVDGGHACGSVISRDTPEPSINNGAESYFEDFDTKSACGRVLENRRIQGISAGIIGLALVAVAGVNLNRRPSPTTQLDRIERTADQAGWHPDPLGRFDARYYDGERWSQHVGRVGPDGTRHQFEDPV